MPVIQTERAALFTKDYRPKNFTGTPFVLIHGAGGTYQNFPIPLRRDLPCIVMDLAGHGRSPQPSHNTITDHASDVVALMNTLDIEQGFLVGHSMGGAIAQQITLDYADRVAGLVLLGTAAKLKVSSQIIEGIIDDTKPTAELIMDWTWGDNVTESIKQQGVELMLTMPPEVIQGDYIACNSFDVRERLTEIAVPTLVIAASEDCMVKPEWSEYLAENIKDAQYKLIEGAGHMFPLEHSDKTVTIIHDWSDKFL